MPTFYIAYLSFLISRPMALRGAVTRLLSNSKKCAAVTVSRAQGTAAAVSRGTFEILYSNFKKYLVLFFIQRGEAYRRKVTHAKGCNE